jgi:hypothetical protein
MILANAGSIRKLRVIPNKTLRMLPKSCGGYSSWTTWTPLRSSHGAIDGEGKEATTVT